MQLIAYTVFCSKVYTYSYAHLCSYYYIHTALLLIHSLYTYALHTSTYILYTTLSYIYTSYSSQYPIYTHTLYTQSLDPSDIITFNHAFTSKLRRIKIPLLLLTHDTTHADTELDAINTQIEEDRRHIVEANIVRIMKSRKRVLHNELLAETIRQLSIRFQPTPQVS